MVQKEMIIIEQTDCLERMRKMEEKSVDLVFYDPPYNVKKKYDGFSDNLNPADYVAWQLQIALEAEKIARRGVVVYVGGKLRRQFSALFPESHMIVVHKRAAGVFAGNYMLQYHLIFSTAKPIKKCKDLWDDIRLPGEGYFFREKRYDHPGLTGLELTKKILEHFTLEDEIVFDPFTGTGTTAVACKLMNRNFIGTEQSKKYVKIAQERLNDRDLFGGQ